MSVRELIVRAAKQLGSESKLADACGVSQNAIWHAKKVGHVSPELAKKIHWATGKIVSGNMLRPDMWAHADHVPPLTVRACYPLKNGEALSAESRPNVPKGTRP